MMSPDGPDAHKADRVVKEGKGAVANTLKGQGRVASQGLYSKINKQTTCQQNCDPTSKVFLFQ